jgi:hypothetical protein
MAASTRIVGNGTMATDAFVALSCGDNQSVIIWQAGSTHSE